VLLISPFHSGTDLEDVDHALAAHDEEPALVIPRDAEHGAAHGCHLQHPMGAVTGGGAVSIWV